MMPIERFGVASGLALALALGVPAAAGADLLGTGIVFMGGDANVTCRISNLGTKPVEILGVRVLGNAPGAGTLGIDTCTGSLVHDSSCAFSGTADSGHIGGAAELKGSARAVRGVCVLTGSGLDPVILELR